MLCLRSVVSQPVTEPRSWRSRRRVAVSISGWELVKVCARDGEGRQAQGARSTVRVGAQMDHSSGGKPTFLRRETFVKPS